MGTLYGIAELRPVRVVTDDTVACHVTGCATVVKRQRTRFQATDEFLCPDHGVYLSPSTFQYQCPVRNLLWREPDDLRLLDRIFAVKRTTERLGRERDEDSVTWNVVRPFHREGRLDRLAEVLLAGRQIEVPPTEQPTPIYWGADGSGRRWGLLEQAQREFHEVPDRGTEPDFALWWPGRLLVFVEAKFCAGNRTAPSPRSSGQDHRPRHYGEHPHFADVFTADYAEIAERARKYELLRMWLLGSWIAQQQGAAFCLVNLVRWGAETDIEVTFGRRYCHQTPERRFLRATWESIWDALPASGLAEDTIAALDHYFRNKSCGYDARGQLQKAFTELSEHYGGRPISRDTGAPDAEGDFLWFHNRDVWRPFWGGPTTMQQVVFRILRGSNDARADLHHHAASERELDYDVARNIVEAFLSSGWRPPGGTRPTLRYDHRPPRQPGS